MQSQIAFLAFTLGTGLASAQGTFVYDQQSTGSVDGTVSLAQTPFGESFTPTLDSIGFIQLQLNDGTTPSTIAINIRSGSITGSLLGTSMPTTLPNNSGGTFDFLFGTPITLTPGTQYYFEPVVVSGGFAVSEITFIQYTGGDLIQSGIARTDRDLWFREGIVTNVPEPSSAALLVMGCTIIFCRHRLKWRMAG
jgi:hypothetical protein